MRTDTVTTPNIAKNSNPMDVMRTIYAAVAVDDIDAAMTLVADDIVAIYMPSPPNYAGPITGRAEMRAWFENLKPNFTYSGVEFDDIKINGNRATWRARFYTENFVTLGLTAVEFEGTNIIQNGLLKQHTWIFTEEFQAKLATANALASNRATATRFMEELWNHNNLDLIDEIIANEFVNHTPLPGLTQDREGLRIEVTRFHEEFANRGARFRIDDLTVTADKVVIRTTFTTKAHDSAPGEKAEGETFIVLLHMMDSMITERWLAWVTLGGKPIIATRPKLNNGV